MGFSLFRRHRRADVAVGRHARVLLGPTVPGAAATLVSSAASWDHARPPREEDSGPIEGPDPTQVEATTVPVPAITDEPAGPVPDHGVAAPGPGETQPPVARASVSLGFADGASVDLPADDPRARTFHAAAAALLESPRG